MLEQCREIVHKFNSTYGETLVMPDILLPENEASMRLPGTDGQAKMSKSLGNCIYLSDDPQELKAKVMSMFTDPDHLRVEDPGKIEGNTVFTYLDAFATTEHVRRLWPEYADLDAIKAHYQRGGLGDVKVKRFLIDVLEDILTPIRQRRAYWEDRIPEVIAILEDASLVAAAKAQKTVERVRQAMRIDYFSDQSFYEEAVERYEK
jgi:tryptophanyl-tRNA synthetase